MDINENLTGVLYIVILTFTFMVLIFRVFRKLGYGKAHKGLPVLMYHKLHYITTDALTVSLEQFEEHLQYLEKFSYTSISCNELIENIYNRKKLPKKPVLITFDDAYSEALEFAVPLLKKYNFRATVFVPVKYIGGKNEWDESDENIADFSELKKLDSTIEIGLHSYEHKNFSEMNLVEIHQDTLKCFEVLEKENINFTPALAFPFGRYQKGKEKFLIFKKIIEECGIKLAFRIGNKINKLPPKEPLLLKRLDIRGDEPFVRFVEKIKFGKAKIF